MRYSKDIEKVVKRIIDDVRINKDEAVIRYTKKFDAVSLKPGQLRVTRRDIKSAYTEVDKKFLVSIKKAYSNIVSFHKKQLRKPWSQKKDDVILGEVLRPVQRVGIYVPGGRFAYPSTVLMSAVPAKVAGVGRIIMVSPPANITAEVLVASDIAGVDEVYRVGGSQAIAALAYGTRTIKKVDKIVGPGNMYVTIAKKLVFGDVGIDLIAGPSEIVILADSSADSDYVIADLLGQVEHGMGAKAILVSISKDLLKVVKRALMKYIQAGAVDIFYAKTITEAIRLVNDIAPEHLEILTLKPSGIVSKVNNAGAIFIGPYTPVAVGDYFAGPSHVLPTNRAARFSSGLSVDDFTKRISVVSYSKQALKRHASSIITLAETEGMLSHAQSIKVRMYKIK